MNQLPDDDSPRKLGKNKVVSVNEAVAVIQDGDMIATGGFVGIGFAEQLCPSGKPAMTPSI
jgi:acyl-CoA hydrolase